MPYRIRRTLAALSLAAASAIAFAADHATPREARALFDQAVKYLKANGPEKSWKAFNNRSGPFVKKDLYVYVIDTKGTYVANG
ncbi:MAG: chemotaxis protein, partial [Dechloromonas sp.]|nr:chemotaxis protein [Dechloromonas sp.]